MTTKFLSSPHYMDQNNLPAKQKRVWIVDDSTYDRFAIRRSLAPNGYDCVEFPDCEAFLDGISSGESGCLVLDICMPKMSGSELQDHLRGHSHFIPTILVTGVATIKIATQAIKMGAIDVLEKPIEESSLLKSIGTAFDIVAEMQNRTKFSQRLQEDLEALTPKELAVLPYICDGQSLKGISIQFGFDVTTASRHQTRILEKLRCNNAIELLRRFAQCSIPCPTSEPTEQYV